MPPPLGSANTAGSSSNATEDPTPLRRPRRRRSDLDPAMTPSIEPASASFLSVALILHCRHRTWARLLSPSLSPVPSEMTRRCRGPSVYLKEGKIGRRPNNFFLPIPDAFRRVSNNSKQWLSVRFGD
ncbi:hypothetical protein LINPERPRIM_LOCUS1044 [Linum perenne]